VFVAAGSRSSQRFWSGCDEELTGCCGEMRCV
jgi:hypothetical protein